MRTVLVLAWIVLVALAVAFALVTRRGAGFVSLVLLALPAVYVWYGVRYGTD